MKTSALILIPLFLSTAALADRFDEIDGPLVATAARAAAGAAPSGPLTLGAIAARPSLFKETRATLLFVRTGAGNYARLLIAPELRRRADPKREPLPVLLIERFDTFDGSNLGSRIARGREIVLFDGFEYDLDTAQVVPPGEGGDVVFRTTGGAGPRLEPLGETRLHAPDALPAPEAGAPPRPTPGRTVVPADFSGRYRLFADGRWSGALDLAVDAKGEVVGRFRSDATGSAHAVTGRVAPEAPGRVRFAVQFPRSRVEFDGYLWTDGKGAMAGTATLLETTFGFFAAREGGAIAPDGVAVKGLDAPGR